MVVIVVLRDIHSCLRMASAEKVSNNDCFLLVLTFVSISLSTCRCRCVPILRHFGAKQ